MADRSEILDPHEAMSERPDRFIEAQQRGEIMDTGVVEEYAAQLRTVRRQREQLRATIAASWQMIGQDEAR